MNGVVKCYSLSVQVFSVEENHDDRNDDLSDNSTLKPSIYRLSVSGLILLLQNNHKNWHDQIEGVKCERLKFKASNFCYV